MLGGKKWSGFATRLQQRRMPRMSRMSTDAEEGEDAEEEAEEMLDVNALD